MSDPGWSAPRPARIPRPTAWPALTAAAVVLLLWSLSTSPVVGGVGAVVFLVTLGGWIRELVHERRLERSERTDPT